MEEFKNLGATKMVDPFMEIWKSRRRVDLFLNVLFEK
jgi:hypothetical protein